MRNYMWGVDLSGSVQGAGGVSGLLAVSFPGTNCFVAFDGNGDLSALLNAASASVLAQYDYNQFGELIRLYGPLAGANPFRFSTKYYDVESDLLYYGNRYLNVSVGKLINPDPLGEDAGNDRYAFVDNEAPSAVDDAGLLTLKRRANGYYDRCYILNISYDINLDKPPTSDGWIIQGLEVNELGSLCNLHGAHQSHYRFWEVIRRVKVNNPRS